MSRGEALYPRVASRSSSQAMPLLLVTPVIVTTQVLWDHVTQVQGGDGGGERASVRKQFAGAES